jgi:hypothetical protein
MIDIEKLKSELREGVVTVVFTKKDGTERTMNCTLSEAYLPKVEIKEDAEPKKAKAVNNDVLAVYDIDAQGWRSFRIDSIKELSGETV